MLLMMISACAPAPWVPPKEAPPRITDAQDAMFQQGEARWRQGDVEQALADYTRYLSRFPTGRHAPEALLRLGTIYDRRGDLGPAEAFYLRLIDGFPESPAADNGRLALLDLLIQHNRVGEAMGMAGRLLRGEPGPETRLALWRRLLTLHQAADDPAYIALYAFFLSREGPPPERERWSRLLGQTIERLDIDEIEALWDRLTDPQVRADLMYRYGLLQVMAEKDDVALEVLTAFRAAFAGHPRQEDAAGLIDMLTERLAFEPYTIGCLLPLSGDYAAFGQRALQGIEMALGLPPEDRAHRPFRLVVADTASSADGAVQGVRALAQARVGAIIGPILTAPAAAREAQRLRIPMVTLTQRSEITLIGDYIFRNFITPQNQVRTLVTYFVNTMGLRDFAVLYPEEPYGHTFLNLFWDEVARQGGRVVGLAAYDPGQTDFKATIGSLVGLQHPVPPDLQRPPAVAVQAGSYYLDASIGDSRLERVLPDPVARLSGLYHQESQADWGGGPSAGRRAPESAAAPIIDFDVLFIPDAPQMAGLILPHLAFHDVTNVQLAGTNLWHSRQLIDMARDYVQNAVLVDGFFIDSRSATVRRFVDTYRDVYQTDPGLVEAVAFDTANLMFDLLARPEIELRHEFRNALQQTIHIDGVTGATAFDPEGEALKTLCLLRIQGSRFIEVINP